MKKTIAVIIFTLVFTATICVAKPKVPKNVKVLFTSAAGSGGHMAHGNLYMTVLDLSNNEIVVIRVYDDEVEEVTRTGMFQKKK